MDKVSVIVPVYNNAAFVERCIRSLTSQIWRDLEILAVDDGSTDESGALLDRLAAEDGRIRVFHQKNGGTGMARNRGLDEASGTWLTFVDGDDYVAPDYLLHLLGQAQTCDAEMVICGLTYVRESGETIRSLIPDRYESGVCEEWTFRISVVCSHFYKREIWERYQVRFCPGERGEDMPVALFFAGVCPRIAVLPEAGYFYVQHAASAMHQFRGLKKYRLPYASLEEAVQKAQRVGLANGRDFFELFALRILATCYFDLARGASREKMDELCAYIQRMLSTYFPDYAKNPLTGVFTELRVPVSQKLAVRLLVALSGAGLLQAAGHILCLL